MEGRRALLMMGGHLAMVTDQQAWTEKVVLEEKKVQEWLTGLRVEDLKVVAGLVKTFWTGPAWLVGLTREKVRTLIGMIGTTERVGLAEKEIENDKTEKKETEIDLTEIRLALTED
jgi:hypothetical protein